MSAVAIATKDTNEGRQSDSPPPSPQYLACRRFLPVAGVGNVFLSSIFSDKHVNPQNSNGDTPRNNNNTFDLILEKNTKTEDVPTNEYCGRESHDQSKSRDAKDQSLYDVPMSSNNCNWELIGTIKSCPEDFVVREIP